MRLQADFENYRKRVSRDTADEIDRRTGKLVESILPVLDACEAAAAHGAEGVSRSGRPHRRAHEAKGWKRWTARASPSIRASTKPVVHEPGDGGTPRVAEVLRTGYRWQGKVLRPAMVKVKD